MTNLEEYFDQGILKFYDMYFLEFDQLSCYCLWKKLCMSPLHKCRTLAKKSNVQELFTADI